MPSIFPPNLSLTERFDHIIGRVKHALAGTRNSACPILRPLLGPIWKRLRNLQLRFAALAEKVRTGTLPAPRKPRPHPATPDPATPRPATERKPDPLPRRRNWLGGMLLEPWWLGGCNDPLREMLVDPELLALAAAAPQLGRLLRPLCRLLNEPLPPFLQLPKRPRRPRPRREPKPKPPKRVDINRMSSVAWGQYVHPDHEGQHHPPARIGYARSRPWRKPG